MMKRKDAFISEKKISHLFFSVARETRRLFGTAPGLLRRSAALSRFQPIPVPSRREEVHFRGPHGWTVARKKWNLRRIREKRRLRFSPFLTRNETETPHGGLASLPISLNWTTKWRSIDYV